MSGPTTASRIYLLEPDERRTTAGGPAVVHPDGSREDLPPLAYRAVEHVLAALRAGHGAKVTPLRPELPVEEAADAIGMRLDHFRRYVDRGDIPHQHRDLNDWVSLLDVIRWDNARHLAREAALDELLSEEPWDEEPGQRGS